MNVTIGKKCSFLDVLRLNDTGLAVQITAICTSIINALTAVTAIVGNSMFLYVYFKVHSIRRPSNVLLASLSITDLLVGVIVQQTSIARRLLEAKGMHNCPLRVTFAFFGFLSAGASFLNVGLIGLDRCLAICLPFWYESAATIQTHSFLVVLVWLFWGMFTVLPFAGVLSAGQYFVCVFVVLCSNLIIVFVSYLLIFRVIREKKNSSPPRTFSISEFATNCPTEGRRTEIFPENHLCPDSNDRSSQYRRGFSQEDGVRTAVEISSSSNTRNEKDNTYTIAILIACMLLCYAPQMTVLLMRGTFGDNESLVFIADTWVDTITFINSSINPLLYCFRLTEIRTAVLRLFRRRTTAVAGVPRLSIGSTSPAYIRSGVPLEGLVT